MAKRKKQKKPIKKIVRPLEFLFNAEIRRKLTKPVFFRYLSKLLDDYDGEELEKLIQKVFDSPVSQRFIRFDGFSYETIGQLPAFEGKASRSKEVIYLTRLFLKHSDCLETFIQSKADFEGKYITGDIEEALKILDALESQYGITVWSIENRIYATYEVAGLEGAKTICEEFKGSISYGWIHYLIDYYLDKIEGDAPDLYIKKISSIINEYRSGGAIEAGNMVSYYILPLDYDPKRSLYDYLLRMSHMPIFDQYLYFQQAIKEKVLVGEGSLLDIKVIEKFYREFECDVDPCRLFYLRKSGNHYETDPEVKSVVREYTVGNYSASCLHAKALIEKDLKYISLIGIYCKSIILTGQNEAEFDKGSMLYQLSLYFIKIYMLSDDCDIFFRRVELLMIRHCQHSWTWSLYSLLFEMFPDIFSKYKEFSENKILISSVFLTPRTSYNLIEEHDVGFFDYIINVLDIADKNQIPNSRLVKHHIYGDLPGSSSLSDIRPDDRHLLPFEIKKIKAKSYLNSGSIEKACEYIAIECMENPSLFRIMPFNEALITIEDPSADRAENNIFIPILYYIYARNVSAERDFLLNEAYEDFISSLGVDMPSDYYLKVSELTPIEEYFLRYVCIPSIMDISPNFQSTDQLSSERMRILDILLQNREIGDKKILEDEVDNILATTIINKSTADIEQSKIHVDIEKLKQAKYLYYSEIFLRYVNAPTGVDVDENSLLDYKSGHKDTLHGSKDIAFISDKKDSILNDLVSEFMFDFAGNQDYGLNKYLSAEIRHNIFVNQLRTRLESLSLVTEKSHGVYVDNDYWVKKYDIVASRVLKKVNDCLKRFSEKFDTILVSANSKIDITFILTDEDKLFCYHLDYDEFLDIKKYADSAGEFSEFFAYLEEFMWNKTEVCLSAARVWLYDELLPAMEGCLDGLLAELKDAKSGVAMNELDDVIRSAKNGVKDDVATVLEWFAGNKEPQSHEIQMHHAIEVSINSFIALHSPKVIEVECVCERDAKAVIFNNDEYKHLILALITAYDNALKYGVNEKGKPISVSFISETNGSWRIIVSNECKDVSQRSILDGVRQALVKPKNKSLSIKEGGTGLYKIQSIISQTFGDSTINFSTGSDNIFTLDIRKDK